MGRHIALLAFLLLLGRTTALAQTPFWQQTALDSGWVIRLATNSQGDIFASVRPSVGHSSYRLYRSTNNGDSWDTLGLGFPNPLVWDLLVVPDVNRGSGEEDIYASIERGGSTDTTYDGIYNSSDNGYTWQRRSSFRFVHALITPDSGRSFLAGQETTYGGVYRSVDSCRTWVRLTPDVSGYRDVARIAITRQGSILAGVLDCGGNPCLGVIRSADNGQTWTRHRTWSGAGADVRRFLIPPQGDYFLVADDGVNRGYYTYDGTDWYSANSGIPPWAAENMNAIAMDSNGTLYVGERLWGPPSGGVYRSTDNGQSWVQWSDGLWSRGVWSLVVNSRGYIFAGQSQFGVMRSINPITRVQQSQEPLPTAFSLSQNYPNPFNPSTKIAYGVPSRELVELRLFDVLGREVTTLVNQVKAPGEYSVSWDATGVASGVYFYTLQAGTYVNTKKLLLMR